MNELKQKYVEMQKKYYVDLTSHFTLDEIKNIIADSRVDCWSNKALKYVEWLFFQDNDYTQCKALDFGCGIGRLIKAFRYRFKQLDGVDLSPVFLEKAREYGVPIDSQLILCNGYDLSAIPDCTYDIIYSGWVMEHICVHEIRYNYFKEFFRVANPNAQIIIQMCGGRYAPESSARAWYENYYEAPATNSSYDVKIDNVFDIVDDLSNIGYKHITFTIYPLGVKTIESCPPPTFAGHQYNIIIRAIVHK